jgi:hypothetical protein
MYPGTESRALEPWRPATPASSRTRMKKNTPPSATGTPSMLPYGLRYACAQLTVALTSQKLL